MKNPDMLINHDTKILMQLIQTAMGKGEGVSIILNSVNQLNVYLEGSKTQRINSPDQKLIAGKNEKSGPEPKCTKEEVVKALEKAGWSRVRASEELGIHRATIGNYITRFQIAPPSGQWVDKRRRIGG
jgi:hypothetical protein